LLSKGGETRGIAADRESPRQKPGAYIGEEYAECRAAGGTVLREVSAILFKVMFGREAGGRYPMRMTGKRTVFTISVAGLLTTTPAAFRTTQRY